MNRAIHRFFAVMLVGSSVVLAYTLVSPLTPSSAPDSDSSAEWLNIDRDACQLGTILAESEVPTVVRVTNSTHRQLQILRISPGCGCLSVNSRKTTLKPDESTFIDCRLKAKSRLGRMGVGFSIQLQDSQARQTTQSILLTADVSPVGGIAWFPEVINFGTVRRNSFVKRVADLTIVSESDVKPQDLGIVESPTGVEARLEFDGREGKLVAILDPTRCARFGTGKISVRNSSESSVFVDVPLSWRVKPSVRAIPSSVVLALKDSGSDGSRGISLECEDEGEFRIRSASVTEKSRNSGILVTAAVNDEVRLTLHWASPSLPTGDYAGTLEIDVEHTLDDLPVSEIVRVPVVIKSRSGRQ